MDFSNFRLNVVSRVVALALLCAVASWGWLAAGWLVTPVVCVLLAAGLVAELIRYVERGTSELTNFLTFVAHHDFSVPPASPFKGRVFTQLEEAYRVLAAEFRRLNRDKAAKEQYLEAVIEHVVVALVCFDDQGQVTMLNEPARKLFALPHLNSMRSFERVDVRLPDLLRQLADGDRTLLSVRRNDETLQLVLFATRFQLVDHVYKLVSFQNIRDELDRHEIDSWQKLIRVLTHEIMNSVTPIISLSSLVRETLMDDTVPSRFRQLAPKDAEDVLRSLAAIHTRSTGLLDFVHAYRSFSNLPTPSFAEVNVLALLERVRTLMASEIAERGAALTLHCADAQLSIRADPHQIEQVLLNLLRNALEALTERPEARIVMRARRDEEERVVVQVLDNGPGIDPAHRDSIFVPFFTTKRSGTGVGLSISRQLAHANRGVLTVSDAPGGGSVFSLRFR